MGWAWNQKPWCTDVQRYMRDREEDDEVKSRQEEAVTHLFKEADVSDLSLNGIAII